MMGMIISRPRDGKSNRASTNLVAGFTLVLLPNPHTEKSAQTIRARHFAFIPITLHLLRVLHLSLNQMFLRDSVILGARMNFHEE